VQRKKEKEPGRSSKVIPKGMQSLQRKVNADSAEVKGEEAPKGGLQRKVNVDSAEVKAKKLLREAYSEKSTLIPLK
jgi:hypothetical protein